MHALCQLARPGDLRSSLSDVTPVHYSPGYPVPISAGRYGILSDIYCISASEYTRSTPHNGRVQSSTLSRKPPRQRDLGVTTLAGPGELFMVDTRLYGEPAMTCRNDDPAVGERLCWNLGVVSDVLLPRQPVEADGLSVRGRVFPSSTSLTIAYWSYSSPPYRQWS